MILKNNFQRHCVLGLLFIFNNLCLSFIFIILKYCYNVSIFYIFIIGILFYFYFNFFYFDYSKKVFKKYCNKDCHNCSMWHCDYSYRKREL